MREDLSGPDDSEEEEEEEEEEQAPASKWQGIESIFEAYQEYVEGEQLQRTRREAAESLRLRFECGLHKTVKKTPMSSCIG